MTVITVKLKLMVCLLFFLVACLPTVTCDYANVDNDHNPRLDDILAQFAVDVEGNSRQIHAKQRQKQEKEQEQEQEEHQPQTQEKAVIEVEVEEDDNIEHVKVKVKPTQHPAAIGIKFKNPRSHRVDYYWWNGKSGVYQGFILPKSVTATNSYIGHVFYFTEHKDAESEFARIGIVAGTNLYILPPESKEHEQDPHYLKLLQEKQFVEEYYKEHGVPWLAHYPRDPPIHWMWPATHIGQLHNVQTYESYWTCIPDQSAITNHNQNEINKCRQELLTNEEAETGDQVPVPIELEIEVISLKPRAFRIMNALSAAEADVIIELANRKLRRSRAGQHGGLESTTRTSENAWIGRAEHIILDTIYRRTADLVNISESLLQPGSAGNIVEELQVVHYENGQEYTAHHDFGDSGRANQRYLTLLFYLNDQLHDKAGGETNFPKGDNGRGLKVHPGKGNAILFYSMLPDGNADDKSLHAALPVHEGVKWLANFWIWDPRR